MTEDIQDGLFVSNDEADARQDELNGSADENGADELEGGEEGELQATTSGEQVVIEKNDRSLAEFHRWYNTGRLNIEPEWQRNYVWDNGRASRLIESFSLTSLFLLCIWLKQMTTSMRS